MLVLLVINTAPRIRESWHSRRLNTESFDKKVALEDERQASTIERPRPGRPLLDDLRGSDPAANHYFALNETLNVLNVLNVRSLNPHLCCVNE